MFSVTPVLKPDHLEEFIHGLEEWALMPMRPQFSKEPEEKYQRALIVHGAHGAFYRHILQNVRNAVEKPLPFSGLETIAKPFRLTFKVPSGSQWEIVRLSPEQSVRIGMLSHALDNVTTCFAECIALQEKTQKELIQAIKAGIAHNVGDRTLWEIGQNYLQKNTHIAAMRPGSPRRPFAQAAADEMLGCFERKAAHENPDIGRYQLRVKCKKDLEIIAIQTGLSLPGKPFQP